MPALIELVSKSSTLIKNIDGGLVKTYKCQATELHNASTALRAFDPRPYFREFSTGNVTIGHFIRGILRAYFENLRRKYRTKVWIHFTGSRTGPSPVNRLDLQPGEMVQVKPIEEIIKTLNSQGRDRGLWFDREMLRFCGGAYRVRQRITKFINDRTGEMIELKNDCITLDGVVCSGDRSEYRHFCPRAIYCFWRESWLRRESVDSGDALYK